MGLTQNMLPVQSMAQPVAQPTQAAPTMPAQNQQPPQALPPISVEQLNKEHDGLDAMIKEGSKLMKKPNLNSNDIIDELAGLVSGDHLTPQMAMNILSMLPKGKMGEEVAPDVYQGWLQQQLQMLQKNKAALTKFYGNPIPKEHHESIKAGTYAPMMGGQ